VAHRPPCPQSSRRGSTRDALEREECMGLRYLNVCRPSACLSACKGEKRRTGPWTKDRPVLSSLKLLLTPPEHGPVTPPPAALRKYTSAQTLIALGGVADTARSTHLGATERVDWPQLLPSPSPPPLPVRSCNSTSPRYRQWQLSHSVHRRRMLYAPSCTRCARSEHG
jgi:hypothetical protein